MRRTVFAALLLLAPAVIWSQSTLPKHLQPQFGNDKAVEALAPPSVDAPVVQIQVAPESPPSASASTIVVATITATRAIGPVQIEVIAGGGVRARAPAGFAVVTAGTSYFRSLPNRNRFIRRLPTLAQGQTLRIRIPVTSSAADGFVAVTVSDPEGISFSENDTLFLGRAEGRTISSASSLLDLRRQRLILRRRSPDFVAPATDLDEALLELEQEGAVGPSGGTQPFIDTPPPPPQAQVTVSGRVEFTDFANRRHPVRGIRVEIRDEDSAGEDDLLATVETNEQGAFSATVPNNDEDGTGNDLHAIAYAIGEMAEVTRATPLNGAHSTWSIKSALHNDVGTGPIDLSIITSNNEAMFPNAVAFEIYEAASSLARYVRTLEGGAAPDLVIIRYPALDNSGNNTDSSSHDEGRIFLGLTDAHDWDNIMHEYGHFLQSAYGFSSNIGGSHNGVENLCTTQSSRDRGLRLVWSESWPTFFALQAQTTANLGALGIPDVGDTLYQDRKPGTDLTYDLEVPHITNSNPPSEGQEHALQYVLWDMFDSANDLGDSDVAFAPAAFWAAAKGNTSRRFSGFWTGFSSPLPDGQRAPLGEILVRLRIGPSTNPVIAPAPGAMPTFRWSALLGCSTGTQMRYNLRFWDPQNGANILETPFQAGTQFTPSAAQIATLFPAGRARVGWTVVARDEASPQTGDYPGNARFFDRP